ncbi:amidase [Phenylobacterium sp. Root77]|uniref:amidase n=1 Tax=unclassified Phenylobacterium TaxID=2640670 RepID=UPI0006F5F38F|nr:MULTISPECIES: amidase [unclassified Phenylobacterium]KQW65548.1 amidase [Phenylobacterium sp. Root1277]KQW94233.1 amidase [Phenylobacterium sp. Root1290]KRC38965.1 amidase [Phenylobacterium sp. Root77]
MLEAGFHNLELMQIRELIQSGRASSIEVTRALLQRISDIDPELHAFVTLLTDRAIAEAAAADAEIAAGRIRGPLHGVPLAVKDLLWTVDAPTTHGMPINRAFMAPADSTVVCRLREAGAVILGKLQQTEGAFGDHHPEIRAPVNPWNPTIWSGVSSSGSGVATAAGMCFGAIGTDTGGSIRFPSAANGLTGLKPTWGRVSRFGAFELAASLDHIGPMARSAADTAVMLAAIAGPDPKDPTAAHNPVPDYANEMEKGIRGLRIGIDRDWAINGVDAPNQAVIRSVIEVCEAAGAIIQEVAFPDTAQMVADWTPLCSVEAAVAHQETFPSQRQDYGRALAGLLDLGRAQSAMDYQQLRLRRAEFTGRVRAVFQDIDLLLIPATGVITPTAEKMDTVGSDAALALAMFSFTMPFDITGSPTITLPGGMNENGTPIGFQFVADHFREDLLFRAGWSYQSATDWHRQRPPV